MSNADAIQKRRIFGIISHPDAGKTTLTEKLLLHGGAIREAGTVKARGKNKFAKSDWMEIEKQRGISVTSSVMQFEYDDKVVSIMDTPGHNDFGEDTYRIPDLCRQRSYGYRCGKGCRSTDCKAVQGLFHA